MMFDSSREKRRLLGLSVRAARQEEPMSSSIVNDIELSLCAEDSATLDLNHGNIKMEPARKSARFLLLLLVV